MTRTAEGRAVAGRRAYSLQGGISISLRCASTLGCLRWEWRRVSADESYRADDVRVDIKVGTEVELW